MEYERLVVGLTAPVPVPGPELGVVTWVLDLGLVV